ncbi:MAG: MotA/TolQ/ExbB proton channel family protein [Planctomycetota bacterium]|jgi:biopolymer transport protein ExbB
MMFEMTVLMEGGYAMIGILLAALVALMETIYCFVILRRKVVLPEALQEVAVGGMEPEQALQVCREQGGPFAEVLSTVLLSREATREESEALVEGAGRRAAHTLSRGIMVLEVVAATAPLLGLLGTVVGMYEAFAIIGEAGVKQIGELPTGISKALITTITGLIVAIPAYVFYSWFSRIVDDLIIEMERYAVRLMSSLRSGAVAEAGSES